MKRITTTVDPMVYRRLDEIAREDGVPTSRLLREAMERYVTEREAAMAAVPLPSWMGMLEGGDGEPWAERDEELLAEGWVADIEAEIEAQTEAQTEPEAEPQVAPQIAREGRRGRAP
jgi:predicted transcriptional regulator